MKTARGAKEFARLIPPAGLSVVSFRNEEHSGRIYGVMFIDHGNGLIINASKPDRAFPVNHFRELFASDEQAAMQLLFRKKQKKREPG